MPFFPYFNRPLTLLLLGAVSLTALLAAAADPNPPSIRGGGAWPIRRQWTPAETMHYARWWNTFSTKRQQVPLSNEQRNWNIFLPIRT